MDSLNKFELDHVFHLGDFIDQHHESFKEALRIIDRLKAPHTQVLGNHDYSVEEQFKEAVPQIMGSMIDKVNRIVPGDLKAPMKAYVWALQNPYISAVISNLWDKQFIDENLSLAGIKVDLEEG